MPPEAPTFEAHRDRRGPQDHSDDPTKAKAKAKHDEMRDLLATCWDAASMAVVVNDNPWHQDALIAYIQEHWGNAMTEAVMKAKRELPRPTDHVSGVKNVATLGTGDGGSDRSGGSTASHDLDAIMPEARLPYTSATTWNAIAIAKNLGQFDDLKGTNNDADRCAFATVLVAKVFEGPGSFKHWIAGFQSTKRPKGMLSDRAKAACAVMDAVVAAVGNASATYGDLQYLQEALYDYAVVPSAVQHELGIDKDGVATTADAMSSTTEWLDTSGSAECTTADQVVKAVAKITDGTRLMVEFSGTPPGGGDRIGHQMMIVRQGQTTYLYDAERQDDGEHLHKLNKANLAKYFDYGDPKFKLAGTFTTK